MTHICPAEPLCLLFNLAFSSNYVVVINAHLTSYYFLHVHIFMYFTAKKDSVKKDENIRKDGCNGAVSNSRYDSY